MKYANTTWWVATAAVFFLSACGSDDSGDGAGTGTVLGASVFTPTASISLVYEDASSREATDLAFNPRNPSQLWVLYREPASSSTCTSSVRDGCASLEGSVVVIDDVSLPTQSQQWLKDGNAWHFMRRPPSLAMGAGATFATCGEERTGNYLDGQATFIGPTLWSSDLSVFAVTPPGGNGSHLDMLHATPWCMGIAHEERNVYWTFNGEVGSLDRYDFAMDHGPGNADHSDGEIQRFPAGLSREPGVPSHMFYNPDDKHVYVNDTGNARVIKLDSTSGTVSGPLSPVWEELALSETYTDVTVSTVVAPGILQKPSGMAKRGDVLYISDYATGMLYAFSLTGELHLSFDTGLGANSVSGLDFGPDGLLYFVHLTTGDVYRVDP